MQHTCDVIDVVRVEYFFSNEIAWQQVLWANKFNMYLHIYRLILTDYIIIENPPYIYIMKQF